MGILGSGCSAAAVIAKAQGFAVDGCDTSTYSEYRDEVVKAGISVANSHDKSHVRGKDLLVVSPAITHYDQQNEEVVEAKTQGIPMQTWQQFSGEVLQKDKFVVAVCGTHGKSTTTAMTAHILEEAGLDPTVQLGAVYQTWGTNYRVGNSKYYVIEADEYGNNFLHYKPDILVVTNIEYDHPEYFRTKEDFVAAFKNFAKNLKAGGLYVLGLGVSSILDLDESVKVDGTKRFSLQIPGEFNQENARLAFTAAVKVGVDHSVAQRALENYHGLFRRLSLLGEANGVKVYDDYGHHPTAIRKTAKAVREQFPTQRIWLVFQPHMFTRTKILLDDFVSVFKDLPVDNAVIVDIFPSREHDTGEISSRDIVDRVAQPNVTYGGSLAETGKMLLEKVKYGDVVVNMGAGDVIELSQILLKDLSSRS